MRRISILLFLCLPMLLMAQQKVAVYVTSSSVEVDDAMKQIVGGELVAAIVKTRQYKAVERTADFLRQINTEQGYQRSGNVDDQQISELGKQFGVDYVCVANIMPYKGSFYLQARMIEVETATVYATARATSSLSDIEAIIDAASTVANALVGAEEEEVTTPSPRQSSSKSSAQSGSEIVRYSKAERKLMGVDAEFFLGETPLDKKNMAKFYFENCPEAYKQYHKGEQMKKAGWSLLGIGTGFMFIGGMCLLDIKQYQCTTFNTIYDTKTKSWKPDNQYYWNSELSSGGQITHMVLSGMAIPIIATGIIVLPLGYKNCNTAYQVFNDNCVRRKKKTYSLNLQSSANGLGLAFKF